MTEIILFTKYIMIALTILMLHISTCKSYKLKCPSQDSWKIRAKVKCNSILKYFCLYNNVERKYVEGCRGPDWDRKGSKRIFSGFFTRGKCTHKRFQPFKFQTNESMSDCIYAKSMCNEEGHIMYNDNSAKDDRTCRCNHIKNFSFIKTPRNRCYCIPREEDCSCYIKQCPVNLTLSADYNCLQNGYLDNQKCIDNKQNESLKEKTRVQMKLLLNETTSNLKCRSLTTTTVFVCLCLIHIIGGFVLVVTLLFHKRTSDKQQQLNRCFKINPIWFRLFAVFFKRLCENLQTLSIYDKRSQTAKNADTKDVSKADKVSWKTVDEENKDACKSTSVDGEPNNGYLRAKKERILVEVHKPFKPAEVKTDEVNFLRIAHLLFRVVCPAVRMQFNQAIPPDQLRKTLSENKTVMEKQYRETQTIINDYQWDLLFGEVKGGTLTSEDLDVRLMIYILSTLGRIEQSDTRIGETLFRIKHIRNEVTQIFDGTLIDDQFNEYWDDIEQAVSKLTSSHKLEIDNDPEETRMIDLALPKRNRKFTDISPEENNFLVVFHGLTNVVWPVIKHQLKTHCPEDVLNKIRTDTYEEETAQYKKDPPKGVDESIKKRIYLTQNKKEQLFSANKKKPRQFDLKLMIYILKLKQKEEGRKEYVDQLDIIDNIRREIVQSSSGLLNETRFQEILKSIKRAVMYLGGEFYEEKLSRLQQIKHILE